MELNQRLLRSLWKRSDRIRLNSNYGFTKFMCRAVSKVVRYLWKNLSFSAPNFAPSLLGPYLKVRSEDFTFQFCRMGYCGVFLSDELEEISESTVFLDVGANIGLFTILASRNKNFVSSYAFEPDYHTLPYLKNNIEFNNSKNVIVFPFAISDQTGELSMKVFKNHSGGSSLSSVLKEDELITIQCVDQEFLNNSCVIPQEASVFVKIDVEGHEFQVLKSIFVSQIGHKVSRIFLEFDVNTPNIDRVEKILKEHGFAEKKRDGTVEHWDALWIR